MDLIIVESMVCGPYKKLCLEDETIAFKGRSALKVDDSNQPD